MSSSNDYGLKLYAFDLRAQNLILEFLDQNVLNESYKMRVTASYGLERFWGEHIRLLDKQNENETDRAKGNYWRQTWKTLVNILEEADIKLPDPLCDDQFKTQEKKKNGIDHAINQHFWNKEKMDVEEHRIAVSILIQLCDSLVWWTQRYKPSTTSSVAGNDEEQATENHPNKI